jgi:hypothetical protein
VVGSIRLSYNKHIINLSALKTFKEKDNAK